MKKRFICALASLAVFLVSAGSLSAAWRPGLKGGFVSGAANKTDYPAEVSIYDGPAAATNYVASTVASETCPPFWANNRTWVYWGEIYLSASNCCFAANIDDWTYLAIDGTVYIEDNTWNSLDRSHVIPVAEGWHAFEVRFGNGGGGAGPSGGIPYGFGINRNGQDSSDMNGYVYPVDPMGMFPAVFRYDDGKGFDDTLSISGEPEAYGKPTPDYGAVSGLQAGSEVSCSAPAVVELAAGEKAILTGWALYDTDVDTGENTLSSTGSDRELLYAHGDSARLLVWQWAVSNYVTIGASEGGSVDQKDQWVLDGSKLTLTALPQEGYDFVKWSGDVPQEQSGSATIALRVDKPMSVVPQFVSAASFGDKTWTGAGDGLRWEDGANWDPAGAPTLSDRVHLPAGKVLAETGVFARSLEVAAGAELWLGASNKVEEAISLYPGQAKNYEVNVIEDLVCAGTLVLGGAGEDGTSQINIGGDFTLVAGAKASATAVRVSAVEETVLRTQPTAFAIGGVLSVAEGATFYVNTDPVSGSHVSFTASDILVDGRIDAVQRGWRYVREKPTLPGQIFTEVKKDKTYYTYAFGVGWDFSRGAGHGGRGGNANEWYGRSYDQEYTPCLPGSPNGCYYLPGPGGGVIRMRANHVFVLNGTLDASGERVSAFGGPSGGSVWIAAGAFEMDDSAELRAHGASNEGYSSGGGGGRICVMAGLSAADISSVFETGELPAGVQSFDFSQVADVRGGRGGFNTTTGLWALAPDGTARYLWRPDTVVNVSIAAAPAHVPTIEPTPARGICSFPAGEEMAFSAPANGLDPSVDNAKRYLCTGYTVSNATGVLRSGAENSFLLPATDGPLWVDWLYGKQEGRVMVYGVTNGSVRIDGVSHTGSVPIWAPDGAALPSIAALPDEGYEFLFWTGDVPYGKAKENPLQLTMDVPRNVRPVFRKAEAPTTRTWTLKDKKGEWLEPSNWEPAGIPGLQDDIVIPGGACNVSNYLECASLALSGNAVLRLATGPLHTYADHCWMYSVSIEGNQNLYRAPDKLGEIALVVHGDLTMADTTKLRLGVDRQPARGRVVIGGDLRMEGTSLAIFSAGPLDGDQVTHVTGSGVFDVAGLMDIGAEARLMLSSDQVTGGSFVVRTKKLHVREGGAIDVCNRGYGYSEGSKESRGPGRGYDYTIGGGYGGFGYVIGSKVPHSRYGQIYGQKYAPVEPGSPAGYYNHQTIASGLIRIHADTATIDGKLLATSPKQPYGGCSGGGIWLTARWIGFGDHAVLDVGGADTGYDSIGGGGRIAIERGLSPEAIDHLAATGELPAGMEKHVLGVLAFTNLYPTVTVNLEGGVRVTGDGSVIVGRPAGPDNAGTFVYLDAVSQGTMLMLR